MGGRERREGTEIKINTERQRQWSLIGFPKTKKRGAWLAQSMQRVTLDLGVVSSSPTLGIEMT